MTEHTARAFDADLEELGRKIGEMGSLDKKQIADAIEALTKRNAVLADHVIATDDRVNALQRAIVEKAVITIALRQPMAVDLREIVGALRISIDLERIGDLAKDVAKRMLLLSGEFHLNEVMLQLQRMGQLVIAQLTDVLESYDRRDVVKALEIWRKDEEVDALNNSLFRELLTYMMENSSSITYCAHLVFCAKDFERIGDHVTNVAEDVYYIVEGHLLSQERPKADILGRHLQQPA